MRKELMVLLEHFGNPINRQTGKSTMVAEKVKRDGGVMVCANRETARAEARRWDIQTTFPERVISELLGPYNRLQDTKVFWDQDAFGFLIMKLIRDSDPSSLEKKVEKLEEEKEQLRNIIRESGVQMKFKATQEQLKQVAVNAVNASIPVGMGQLHFRAGDYRPEQIEISADGFVNIDYFQGRMVKLNLNKISASEDMYLIPNGSICNPDKEYQSWSRKYPTYKNLLIASGIKPEDILMEG